MRIIHPPYNRMRRALASFALFLGLLGVFAGLVLLRLGALGSWFPFLDLNASSAQYHDCQTATLPKYTAASPFANFADHNPADPTQHAADELKILGFIDGKTANLDAPATRGHALALLPRLLKLKMYQIAADCADFPYTDVPLTDPLAPALHAITKQIKKRQLPPILPFNETLLSPDTPITTAEVAILYGNAFGLVDFTKIPDFEIKNPNAATKARLYRAKMQQSGLLPYWTKNFAPDQPFSRGDLFYLAYKLHLAY